MKARAAFFLFCPPRRPQDVSVNLKMVIGFQLKHSNPAAHLKALISRIGYRLTSSAFTRR